VFGILVEPGVRCDWTVPHHGLSQEMLSYGHEQEKHKEAPDENGVEEGKCLQHSILGTIFISRES